MLFQTIFDNISNFAYYCSGTAKTCKHNGQQKKLRPASPRRRPLRDLFSHPASLIPIPFIFQPCSTLFIYVPSTYRRAPRRIRVAALLRCTRSLTIVLLSHTQSSWAAVKRERQRARQSHSAAQRVISVWPRTGATERSPLGSSGRRSRCLFARTWAWCCLCLWWPSIVCKHFACSRARLLC